MPKATKIDERDRKQAQIQAFHRAMRSSPCFIQMSAEGSHQASIQDDNPGSIAIIVASEITDLTTSRPCGKKWSQMGSAAVRKQDGGM